MDGFTHRAITNEELVVAAAATLSGKDFFDRTVLEEKVTRRALAIRRLITHRSTALEALEAYPLVSVVDSVEYEESSRRHIISFIAERGDGSIETARTRRMDGEDGDLVRRMVAAVKPGMRAVVYKTHEEMPNGRKVRIVPWVQPLGPQAE